MAKWISDEEKQQIEVNKISEIVKEKLGEDIAKIYNEHEVRQDSKIAGIIQTISEEKAASYLNFRKINKDIKSLKIAFSVIFIIWCLNTITLFFTK